ncbi:hypothetical protein ZOSMA_7G00430 [Zostera marina]|uniref:Wound-responsive family protein n=1 Tax=Zostera marina TaxID=29655 RepID=A0A0K9NPV3_ZOSMR|nr:hypothetical protein ZOSMA_7G00430 [Zostera marina]
MVFSKPSKAKPANEPASSLFRSYHHQPTSFIYLYPPFLIPSIRPTSRSKITKTSKQSRIKMSSSSRAWAVAASMSAVEALKDQGICRWNHAFRSIEQHARTNLGSVSQTRRGLSSSIQGGGNGMRKQQSESEESLRKVMYLSCWGPN